ncbi:hypothetical protein ARMSODRAFT_130490 [Armillaria solidipes]|uniref:Uncharacterized protein n=1 Tax=Armillaria solidipes TaxID=1076256 RepID=A0A2H3BHB7_9AGAR|nr:hypothetical protein ARMSODRAFT_130490 [Armillaria solidipes]
MLLYLRADFCTRKVATAEDSACACTRPPASEPVSTRLGLVDASERAGFRAEVAVDLEVKEVDASV